MKDINLRKKEKGHNEANFKGGKRQTTYRGLFE